MKVLAVFNIKGGVGKTAAAVNLSYFAAREGRRTLIWDLDPQASTTFFLRVKPKIKGGGKGLLKGKRPVESAIKGTDFPGFDVLPGDFSFRKLDRILEHASRPEEFFMRLIKTLGKYYDLLVFDCAPGMNVVSETLFKTTDALVVPTIPTTLSLRTLAQLGRYLGKVGESKLQVLPFFSMVDRRKSLHRQVCLEESYAGFPFLQGTVPYSSIVEQMGLYRAPVAAFAPSCRASLAFERLWLEIDRKVR
ncbi:MAG: ParA family protein [Acidobacteriota bacterium]|nr:MAG: ParA family protein [Acidobacteriota bacterium]